MDSKFKLATVRLEYCSRNSVSKFKHKVFEMSVANSSQQSLNLNFTSSRYWLIILEAFSSEVSAKCQRSVSEVSATESVMKFRTEN